MSMDGHVRTSASACRDRSNVVDSARAKHSLPCRRQPAHRCRRLRYARIATSGAGDQRHARLAARGGARRDVSGGSRRGHVAPADSRTPSRSASATTRSTCPGSSGSTTRSASGSWASPTSASPSSPGPGWSRARASSTGAGSTTRSQALADAEGLKVVMCTPTATPPAWLIRKHPEILPIGRAGPRPQLRLAQALRPRQPDLPRALPPDHHARSPSATESTRPSPAGRPTTSGAATAPTRSYGGASRDAFRVWLEAALRHARGAERGLGQRLLEPGVHRLGPDRPAAT